MRLLFGDVAANGVCKCGIIITVFLCFVLLNELFLPYGGAYFFLGGLL
jgi:hypothetical protein